MITMGKPLLINAIWLAMDIVEVMEGRRKGYSRLSHCSLLYTKVSRARTRKSMYMDSMERNEVVIILLRNI